MITIKDGRTELYQWDTGRILNVPMECTQVHYSNKFFGRSIDVDVQSGEAIIPDILLQSDKDLEVWAFVGTAENGYTKISKTFKVNKRNKPADYVFTPTEQTSLEDVIVKANEVIAEAESFAADAAQSADDAKSAKSAAENAKSNAAKSATEAEVAFAGAKQAEQNASNILARNEEVAVRTPYVGANGNWYVWNIDMNAYEDSGTKAQGEKGDKGDKGEQGEQGLQGIQGEKGDKGDTGVQGEKGEQGIQGIQGEKGDRGEKGEQGEKGEKGDTGAQGENGDKIYVSATVPENLTENDIWLKEVE